MLGIWTDGGCVPNPGAGGWGYTMRGGDGRVLGEAFGGELGTTNNRMELTAILMALRALPAGGQATVFSDSQYCVNGLTTWRRGWQRRNWHTKDGEAMPNRDLWLALETELARVQAAFVWVRGHSGDVANERADELAEQGRQAALVAGEAIALRALANKPAPVDLPPWEDEPAPAQTLEPVVDGVLVSEQLIRAGESGNGGWSKAQMALIGVSWPPQKGWKTRAIDTLISRADAEAFIALRGKGK